MVNYRVTPKKWRHTWLGPTTKVFDYRRSLSSQLEWAERSTIFTTCLHIFLAYWMVLLNGLINKIEFFCYIGMRNWDIARKLGVAPPNVRRTIKRFQELATPVIVREVAESAQSTPLGTASSSKNAFNECWQCLWEKIPMKPYLAWIGPPNSQTRASAQAVQAPKGSILTADNKRVRLYRCRRVFRRVVAPLNWERILFTDGKLFTIEQAHNHQNDRSWCA